MARLIQQDKQTRVASYGALRRAVGDVLVRGRSAAEALKLQVYWQIGMLIQDYVRNHPEETAYGKGLFQRLGQDLEMEPSTLNRMVKLVRLFPNSARWPNLRWSHYKVLMTIAEDKQRTSLARQAHQEQWPAHFLEERVQKAFSKATQQHKTKPKDVRLAEPVRGKAGALRMGELHDIHHKQPKKVLDYGFWVYRQVNAAALAGFKKGDWVRWHVAKKRWQKNLAPEDAYTYEAKVERVVDGDTLLVQVLFEGQLIKRQYLRLAGVDAKPLKTKEGLKSQRQLHKLLASSPKETPLLFRSRFMDRYDRAIADVWLGETYVNQALLEFGAAELYAVTGTKKRTGR